MSDLTRWLMENGGPIIRWRTATELLSPSSGTNLAVLCRPVLAEPQDRNWSPPYCEHFWITDERQEARSVFRQD